MPKVLFLLPYPIACAPSQRFRVEQFLPVIEAHNKDNPGDTIDYVLAPFMSEGLWRVLYKGGSAMQKGAGILKGFLKRLYLVLLGAGSYDYIFIHREAAPLGPPVMEWILRFIWRKKLVFDFDDAIWIPNTSSENRLAALFKANWKTKYLCKWSYKVAAGNAYLKQFALDSGARDVNIIPTVVNCSTRYNQLKYEQEQQAKIPVVGWTGSHSTLKYLDELLPLIQKLQERYDFKFLVIADKEPDFRLRNFEFVPWNATSEISDLLKIDIGVMPLTADKWSEGKCGFKLIQYLALGIPAVASPVGVNKVIVQEGENGFLCHTVQEWEAALEKLLQDADLRRQYGINGRKKIVAEYSIASQSKAFVELFR